MPKILHLINGEHYSGAERVQDLLGEHLPRYNYITGFVCLKRGIFVRERRDKAPPIYTFPMRFRGDLSPLFKVIELVNNDGYQVVHTHTPRSALVGNLVSKRTGIPMIHHVHSPTSQCTERGLRNFITTKLERVILTRASKLISVSRSVADYLLDQGFHSDKVEIVCNGVRSKPLPVVKVPTEGRWTVGTMGLFRPRKGIEILLRAVAELRNRGISTHVRLVGACETMSYEKEIKRLVNQLGIQDQVVWTGFTDNTEREFEQMHLFVLPSLYGEGLPMVVLEAMAAGVPIVATRVQGIPEAIKHGETGILVEPENAIFLTDALQSIITGRYDWSAIRRASAAHQAKYFSVESMARGIAQIYDEVLH